MDNNLKASIGSKASCVDFYRSINDPEGRIFSLDQSDFRLFAYGTKDNNLDELGIKPDFNAESDQMTVLFPSGNSISMSSLDYMEFSSLAKTIAENVPEFLDLEIVDNFPGILDSDPQLTIVNEDFPF